MVEVLEKAGYQAVDPQQQARGEDLVRRLIALADLENERGLDTSAENVLRVADEVMLVNYFARLPKEVRNNYVLVFDQKSAHAQFTNPN